MPIMPLGTFHASIFDNDIFEHGLTIFNEIGLMFNSIYNIFISKHYIALDFKLQEMKEK